MGAMLTNLRNTVAAGFVLTTHNLCSRPSRSRHGHRLRRRLVDILLSRLHVISGTMWIGLLWYFNFVQIPNMDKIPDEQKPAIGKVIAPAALWWFRWSAMATMVDGSDPGLDEWLSAGCSFSGADR